MWYRSVSGKREMSARFVVVLEVCRQDSDQVGFVEHHDVIQTLTQDGANEAFDERSLPGRTITIASRPLRACDRRMN